MIPLRDELKQEITEWNLVIRRITEHKKQNNVSDGDNIYLDAVLSQAETNKGHIQKRIDKESNLVEAPVMLNFAGILNKRIKFWLEATDRSLSTRESVLTELELLKKN